MAPLFGKSFEGEQIIAGLEKPGNADALFPRLKLRSSFDLKASNTAWHAKWEIESGRGQSPDP